MRRPRLSGALLLGLISMVGADPKADPKGGDPAIEIKAKLVEDLSSEYFGYFDFEIINSTDQWLVLRDVAITYEQPLQTRHIRAISGQDFLRWQEVMRKKIAKSELSKNTTLAVIGALGYGLAMASGNSTLQNVGAAAAVGAAGAYTASEYSKTRDSIHQTKRFPENHLLADSIVVLPGLSEGRWVLLNSSAHDSIPQVTAFTIHYALNDGTRGTGVIKVGKTPWQKSLWWKPHMDNPNMGSGIYR